MKLTSHTRGLYAEIYALIFLFFKGYEILAWRYKTSLGEIDIIAAKRGQLICVEVKNRALMGSALEAVTPQMRSRIARCARHFIARQKRFSAVSIRFDLIAVSGFKLMHLDNAWEEPT